MGIERAGVQVRDRPWGRNHRPIAGSDGEEIKEDVSLRIVCRDPGPNTSSS